MSEQFYTILTNIGKAKIANSLPTGQKINFTKMKIGDGNGKYYNPSENQTDLVNKIYECNVTSVEVDENNPSWITITSAIPSEVGGFSIREVGVFDDANSLIAIGKYPETYKPVAADGSTKELYIKMTLEVTNTASVELKIDPTVILATKKDITNLKQKVDANLNSINFKGCYLEKTLSKLYKGEDVTIIFAGDSVTCGSNSSWYNKSFVGLFCTYLADIFKDSTVIRVNGTIRALKPIVEWTTTTVQTGTKNTITIVNAGVSGDSMYQMFNRLDNFTSYNSIIPDAIFVMDGINDSIISNTDRYSPTNTFKTLLKSFVDTLRDRTKAEIVLMTSHWCGETPKSVIDEYVKSQKEIADEENILLIDNKAVWNNHYTPRASNHGQGDWMTADDDIHPTDEGHKAIFSNIIDNLYKTRIENAKVIKKIELDENKQYFHGTWTNTVITDSNGLASYTYKRGGGTTNDTIKACLTGNEIYVIVRDGRDTVVFNNNSPQYPSTKITIGGSEYPTVLKTVTNADMFSAHNRRVLLYKGDLKYCEITLQCVSGNLDLAGFETVTYKTDITTISDNYSNLTEITLYVDSINGNDNNVGTSTEKPFKTIAKAVSIAKNNSDKTIIIYIMSDTTENVNISYTNSRSADQLVICGYNSTIKKVGQIKAERINKATLKYLKPVTSAEQSILLNGGDYVILSNIDISDSTNSTKTGLYITNSLVCYASNIIGGNKNVLLHCEQTAELTIGFTGTISGCTTNAEVIKGSCITFMDTNIGSDKLVKNTGGIIYSSTGTLL